jgi:endonuclease YncB( thermonuclease family)
MVLFAPATAPACSGELCAVAGIISGNAFTLASGDTVRLASIEATHEEEKNGEPLGSEAKVALVKLLAGHRVCIDPVAGGRDRHDRLLGQVYDEKGNWIQGEMLRQGLAMTYSFSDDSHDIILRMLAQEKQAQAAKLGIWSQAYFRVISPEQAAEFINRYKLVEGRVVSVHDYHGHTYVNFSEHWKGNFAVFISRKYAEAFAQLNLQSLVGKIIRVRGWIDFHNAPVINLTHTEQIEVE